MTDHQLTTIVIFICTTLLWLAVYFIFIQPKRDAAKFETDQIKRDFLTLYLAWLELNRRNKLKRPDGSPPLPPIWYRFSSEYAESVERGSGIKQNERIKDLEYTNPRLPRMQTPPPPPRKMPEYISPEKEYVTNEQINEIRDNFASRSPENIIEITGKLTDAQISQIKDGLTDFLTAKDSSAAPPHLYRYILGSEKYDYTGLYVWPVVDACGMKTIHDAAELVGNYGQPMTFKK